MTDFQVLTMTRRWVPSRLLVMSCAALLLAAPRGLRGQVIGGRVTAKADGAAVAGAIVSLADSTGRVLTTKLANDAGLYTLTAPAAGRYTVRVERVGFRSAASAVTAVRQGETINLPMIVDTEGVSLRALRVSADRRCIVRPQEGLAVAQLWNEARKALSATELTQLAQTAAKTRRDPHRFTVRFRKFSRDLDPHSFIAMREDGFEVEAEAITPFVAADPELLVRDGYIVGELGVERTYYAPDASILLSDRFLDTHCFQLQEAARDKRDALIGLAFEPLRLTTREHAQPVEVRGVLWLDRATAELRYMEYSYANLSLEERDSHAGGQMEFRPLPDGRWIVWRWYIRMPRYQRKRTASDGIRPSEERLELVMLREEGAEITSVMPPNANRTRQAVLRGTVFDSLRGGTLGGVRVFLSGTSLSAITDSTGSYVIDSVPPGRYVASVLTPRLDSLLLDPPSRSVTLSAGEEKALDFSLPSFRTLATRLCSGAASDSVSLILGVIRDTSSATAAGATVRAEWTEVLRRGMNGLQSQPVTNETTSTAGGRYALCGLPSEKRLTIRARQGGQVVTTQQPPAARGEVRRLDLTLRKP